MATTPYRIAFVGAAATGKTTCVQVLKGNPPPTKYYKTIGAEVHPLSVDAEGTIIYTVWDMGAEYPCPPNMDATLIFYREDRVDSCLEAVNKWIPDTNGMRVLVAVCDDEAAGPPAPIMGILDGLLDHLPVLRVQVNNKESVGRLMRDVLAIL
jgi:hypothetical protein